MKNINEFVDKLISEKRNSIIFEAKTIKKVGEFEYYTDKKIRGKNILISNRIGLMPAKDSNIQKILDRLELEFKIVQPIFLDRETKSFKYLIDEYEELENLTVVDLRTNLEIKNILYEICDKKQSEFIAEYYIKSTCNNDIIKKAFSGRFIRITIYCFNSSKTYTNP